MAEEKQKRGFALLPLERRRLIARKGGRAAHAKGRGHEWTRDEAREAGRKGGSITGARIRERNRGAQ